MIRYKRSEKGILRRKFAKLRLQAHLSGYKDVNHPYYCYRDADSFKIHNIELFQAAARRYVWTFFGTKTTFLKFTGLGNLTLK